MRPTVIIGKLFPADYGLYKSIKDFRSKNQLQPFNIQHYVRMQTVTLRTRPLKKGMLSFYLDYYPGYRDQETMKTIRHEGLNIYIYANPKNQRERDFNATMSEKAEAIRCRRFEAIVNERYDFFDKRKYKADFLEYYRKQIRKHDQNGDLSISTSTISFTANALSKK